MGSSHGSRTRMATRLNSTKRRPSRFNAADAASLATGSSERDLAVRSRIARKSLRWITIFHRFAVAMFSWEPRNSNPGEGQLAMSMNAMFVQIDDSEIARLKKDPDSAEALFANHTPAA